MMGVITYQRRNTVTDIGHHFWQDMHDRTTPSSGLVTSAITRYMNDLSDTAVSGLIVDLLGKRSRV